MELDCRYSSTSEAEGSETAVEVEIELEGGLAVVGVSGTCCSVFLRFLSLLDDLSSDASSRFLRFFLRSGPSEAGIPDNVSLT